MTEVDEKATLTRYVQRQRDALVWKVEGIGERQARWPMTPTGTNLLGLLKHVGNMEYAYFGEVFGRPARDPMLVDFATAADNDDMWARADEPAGDVVAFFRRACAHADATIAALSLDDTGTVPWWPQERRHPSLRAVLVHHLQEIARHAGHADIVRELSDGRVGLSSRVSNLPEQDAAAWAAYRAKLEAIADSFPANG